MPASSLCGDITIVRAASFGPGSSLTEADGRGRILIGHVLRSPRERWRSARGDRTHIIHENQNELIGKITQTSESKDRGAPRPITQFPQSAYHHRAPCLPEEIRQRARREYSLPNDMLAH